MSGMMALLGADPPNITENPHAHHNHHDHAAMLAAQASSSPSPVDHSAHHHGHHMNHGQAVTGDHSGHSGGHTMAMWFHGGVNEVVLFSCWKISSVTGMSISFIGIFILAVLYEGLKCFREYLTKRACYCSGGSDSAEQLNHRCPTQCCENGDPNGTSAPLQGNGSTPKDGGVRVVNQTKKIRGPPLHWLHFLQTALHVLQIVVSYCLMLVFMTYNVWLCLAVALGAGVGYFLFGWRRAAGGMDLNEHCN